MSDRAWCQALSTELGKHTHAQQFLADRLREKLAPLPNSRPSTQLLGFIYERSEVRKRHVEADLGEVDARSDWRRLVNEATISLARRALAGLGDLSDVGAFVVVSTSFAGFPSLSRVLQERVGMPLSAVCYDLTGLGCAGPTQGLHMAQTLLDAGHGPVCLLFVDVMGTHGQCRQWTSLPEVGETVAHCLASDGAAAMRIGRVPGASPVFGYDSVSLKTRLWAESLEENDYNTSADGQPFMAVGKQIRTRLAEETAEFFTDEVRAGQILLHPGGIALMKLVRESYPDLSDTVELSTEVLRDHGNIGSASVLFVLREALRCGDLASTVHLFALGPGIVTTMLRLDGVVMGASRG